MELDNINFSFAANNDVIIITLNKDDAELADCFVEFGNEFKFNEKNLKSFFLNTFDAEVVRLNYKYKERSDGPGYPTEIVGTVFEIELDKKISSKKLEKLFNNIPLVRNSNSEIYYVGDMDSEFELDFAYRNIII